MTIGLQFASFFSMLLAGVYLGCMFDTNERMIQGLKGRTIINFLFQFLFWLIQSFLIFYMLVKINGGQVRLYFILAIIIGFICYFLIFRRLYQSILEKVISILIRFFTFIWRLIDLLLFKPIMFFGRILLYLFNLVLFVFFNLIYLFLKLIKWMLKPIIKLIPKNIKKYLHSIAGIYSKIENIVIKQKKL